MRSKGVKIVSGVLYLLLAASASFLFYKGVEWVKESDMPTEITEIRSANVTAAATTRKEYVIGEELNTNGVEISVTTKEGKKVAPKLENCKIEADMATAGKKPVVVSWQEGTILYRGSYTIDVFSVHHLDIRPMSSSVKLVYGKDETEFNSDGIEVWAAVLGEPKELDKPVAGWNSVIRLTKDQYTVTASELGTPGIHDAILRSGNQEKSYQYAVEGNAINVGGAVKEFGLNEEFKPAGVNVYRISKNDITTNNPLGKKDYKESEFTYSADTTTIGTSVATIEFEGAKANYNINVYYNAFACENVSAYNYSETYKDLTLSFYWAMGTTQANIGKFKMTYLDANGIRQAQVENWGYYDGNHITMWANNGTISTCEIFTDLNICRWNVTGSDDHAPGDSDGQTFSIYYPYLKNGDDFVQCYAVGKIDQTLAMKNGIDAKTVEIQTEKTVYSAGDKFSTADLKIVATLWNGGSRELSAEEYTMTRPVLKTSGKKYIVVNYGSIEVKKPVVVTGIALDLEESKTAYLKGESFSLGDLVFKNYTGTTEEVVVPDEIQCEFVDLSTIGEKKVNYSLTIGGEEMTGSYTITVTEPREVESLQLNYSSARREYLKDAPFSSDKLIVTVKYTDGTSDPAIGYTVSTPDMTTVGVKTITVSYGEHTASYQIMVIPDVDWSTSKMDFANVNGNTLEYYRTELTSGQSVGWFLLKQADGGYKMEQVTCNFNVEANQYNFNTSSDFNINVTASEGLQVTVSGMTFEVAKDYWHRVVAGA